MKDNQKAADQTVQLDLTVSFHMSVEESKTVEQSGHCDSDSIDINFEDSIMQPPKVANNTQEFDS